MKTIEKCFKVLDKISFILSALCVGGMLICVFLHHTLVVLLAEHTLDLIANKHTI